MKPVLKSRLKQTKADKNTGKALAQEIERKFLPASEGWRGCAAGTPYLQGYLCAGKGQTVRVRLAGDQAFLTIKGPTQGISRAEFEYPIPEADVRELFLLCPLPLIEKIRYSIEYAGLIWEVDEFFGANRGLVVIEVELDSAEQTFIKPEWVGAEVSGDSRYSNAMLSRRPYSTWEKG